jgi:hypothetical protein
VSVPFWAAELAQAFWTKARFSEPFPRNLCRAIARAVPLSVVLLPRLSVRAALGWLEKCGLMCEITGTDRPLRACLVARRGHGIALVDGADEDAEQRYSIAHELAHFLRHYWSLRRRIRKQLGEAALEVFDGERPPTSEERLHALLRNVSLGFHLHLMERDDAGKPVNAAIALAEGDADRLAYELLAPAEHVLAHGVMDCKQALADRLRQFYGLPVLQASEYARVLLPRTYSDSLLVRLRSLG